MIYNDTNSVTLNGLKQDVYFLGKCNSESIEDGDLNRIINKYYGQVQEAIRAVNENFYMVVATADLAIGNGSYTFPDGTGTAPSYDKIKSIWAAFNPADISAPLSTEYERAICIDPDAISDPSYTFSTPTALMFGTYFILLPTVTDITRYPVINGVKIYYICEQDRLIDDNDVPMVFPSFQDAITHGALIDVAERLRNDKLKADSVAFFQKRIADIKSYASARLPDLSSIVEGQEAQGGWVFPFGQKSMS